MSVLREIQSSVLLVFLGMDYEKYGRGKVRTPLERLYFRKIVLGGKTMSRSTKFKTGNSAVYRVRPSSTGVHSLKQPLILQTMDRMDFSGLAPMTKAACLFVLLLALLPGPTWAYHGGLGTLALFLRPDGIPCPWPE